MLLSKPGSGKTPTALTAVDEMWPDRCLILGTKRICETVWRQEAAKWEHLQDCTFDLCFGTPAQRREILFSDNPAQYLLINYELLPWLVDELPKGSWPFDAVIFDELSMMKSVSAKRFKKIRGRIDQSPIRVGLTGTPRGNSMLGMFGQMWCIDGERPLGPTQTAFKMHYFHPVDRDRFVWRPNAGAEEAIMDRVKPWTFSIELSPSPTAHVNPVPVILPPSARKQYEALREECMIEIDGRDVRSPTAMALSNKLQQVCSGSIYVSDDPLMETWVPVHDAKLDAMEDLVNELQGAQVLIFYNYRHELDRIEERLGKIATIKQLDDWLAGKVQCLVVHPKSAGHGLNLHEGGCCDMIWFGLPWSQELWEQGNHRLARQGQKNRVTANVLVAENTIEDRMARALQTHTNLQDAFIQAVRLAA